MPHPVKIGNKERMSYSRIEEILEVPNLIEIQQASYRWFLEEGLGEVFNDISPIEDYTGNLILEFVDYKLEESPKYSVEESKERDMTYSAPIKVKVRLINKDTGEVKEQEVFMGDFPIMTETGTFIINGAERVIVSQLVRSPGVYYHSEYDKSGNKLFSSTLIPNRGAWLEYETDSNGVVSVRIDRTRKQPITILLRALGYSKDQQIIDLLGEDERLLATLEKDNTTTSEDALLEIYKKLRPGEPPTVESATSLLNSLFFDQKRYDLAKVGRYKFNKKLSLATRIIYRKAAENIVDPNTGEVLVETGKKITRQMAEIIQNTGLNQVLVYSEENQVIRVIGNHFVDLKSHVSADLTGLKSRDVFIIRY
jgi:DNA-directed RNA polymerase subunit beta